MNDEELLSQIEQSLIECFEYGKTAINHNPPLVESRRLKRLLAKRDESRDQQIALAAQVEILKQCKQSADQTFGNVKQDIYVWLDESERALATFKAQEPK